MLFQLLAPFAFALDKAEFEKKYMDHYPEYISEAWTRPAMNAIIKDNDGDKAVVVITSDYLLQTTPLISRLGYIYDDIYSKNLTVGELDLFVVEVPFWHKVKQAIEEVQKDKKLTTVIIFGHATLRNWGTIGKKAEEIGYLLKLNSSIVIGEAKKYAHTIKLYNVPEKVVVIAALCHSAFPYYKAGKGWDFDDTIVDRVAKLFYTEEGKKVIVEVHGYYYEISSIPLLKKEGIWLVPEKWWSPYPNGEMIKRYEIEGKSAKKIWEKLPELDERGKKLLSLPHNWGYEE